MRIVPVGRIEAGMRLARPVEEVGRGGRRVLLREGAHLDERMGASLRRRGVFAVYVDDPLSEGIAPARAISPETRRRAIDTLAGVFAGVRGTDGRRQVLDVDDLRNVVQAVLAEVRESSGLVSCLTDLETFDRYTLGHSVNVCVLGLLIGEAAMRSQGYRDWTGATRRDRMEDRLVKLGLGLLLHDVGKITIPYDILTKPGRLTDEEMEIVRTHPQAGLDMLRAEALSSVSRTVVIGHHERVDGTGYPHGRAGDAIHPFARVAAIADVYDAVSSDRSYRRARPSHEAHGIVLAGAGTQFDPELVEIFARLVAPYQEGLAVLLSDGRRGLVAANSPESPTRPVVRVTHGPDAAALAHPDEVDLAARADLDIVDSLGHPADPHDPIGDGEGLAEATVGLRASGGAQAIGI